MRTLQAMACPIPRSSCSLLRRRRPVPHVHPWPSSVVLRGAPLVQPHAGRNFCRGEDLQVCGRSGRGGGLSTTLVLKTGRARRGGVARCKGASAAGGDGGGEMPPGSREEAIEQAAASVSGLLEKALQRQGPATVKQRKEQRQVKLRVEIPVLDDSPSSLVSLTLDLVSALFRGKKKAAPAIAVLFAEGSAVDQARAQCANRGIPSKSFSFFDLQQTEREIPGDVPVVVVVGAKFEENATVQELAKNVSPRPIVMLNPEWSPEDEKDATWGSLLTSFEVAYSFVPLSIQGFFSTTEGAVLKHVTGGAPGGRPWLIFVKENDNYKRVSSLKRRPDSSDLESALYNSMAANSPVTRSIKFLRGLVSKE